MNGTLKRTSESTLPEYRFPNGSRRYFYDYSYWEYTESDDLEESYQIWDNLLAQLKEIIGA